MGGNEKISIAALINVILRRKIGRTIDVQWLVKNEVYAREIISLSREQGLDDWSSYTNNLEALIFGVSKTHTKPIDIEDSSKRQGANVSINDVDEKEIDVSKYIGHLR